MLLVPPTGDAKEGNASDQGLSGTLSVEESYRL